MKPTFRIGIILLNWNCGDETVKCISSLLRYHPGKDIELLIIDNNSANDDKTVLLKLPKTVKVVYNKSNVGYAKGVNQGIQYFLKHSPKITHLLILNNDIWCNTDFISLMMETIESDSSIGIVNPLIVFDNDHQKYWFTGGKLDLSHGLIANQYIDQHTQKIPKRPYLVDWNTGCASLVKREVIENIGMLDEQMGMYVEDVDFSLRARKSGYSGYVEPRALIYHKVSSSTGGSGNLRVRYMIARNTMLLMKKTVKMHGISTQIQIILRQLYIGTGHPYGLSVRLFLKTIQGIFDGLIFSIG